MGGFSLLLVMFPFLAGMIGVIIAIISFAGICLMVGGLSGFVINKLYAKEKGEKLVTVNNLWYYITFASGAIIFLIPIVTFIYNIILIANAAFK